MQGVLLEDPGFLEGIFELVLQQVLEARMTEHVGSALYERTERRVDHRNGHNPRTLKTRVGTLNLLVPQDAVRKVPTSRMWRRFLSLRDRAASRL